MRWYAYENVCVNGEDNIRHHANDTVALIKSEYTRVGNGYSAIFEFSFHIQTLSETSKHVWKLHGVTLLLGCWRANAYQPFHFMFSYGKLYALFHDTKSVTHIDNILFWQCPDIFSGPRKILSSLMPYGVSHTHLV